MGFKAYVNKKGYSLNALAKKANIPYTTIKSIHQTENLMKATLHNVLKIADALDVTVEELVKGVNEDE